MPAIRIALALCAVALLGAPNARAAEQLSAEAQQTLLEKANAEVREGNDAAAFADFKNLAELGNARGQAILGGFYLFGQAVEQDRDKAIYWLKLSASQGDDTAMWSLSFAYLYADTDSLRHYRTKASENDHIERLKWLLMAKRINPGGLFVDQSIHDAKFEMENVVDNRMPDADVKEAERRADIELAPILVRKAIRGKPKDVAVDILMSRMTSAMKDGRYADAIPVFTVLEEQGAPLPESFYFYQADALMRAGDKAGAQAKADAFITKYGKGSTHYARMIEILSQ